MVIVEKNDTRVTALTFGLVGVICLVVGFAVGRYTAPSPSVEAAPSQRSRATTTPSANLQAAEPTGLAALNDRLQVLAQTAPTNGAPSSARQPAVLSAAAPPAIAPQPPATFPPQHLRGSGQAATEGVHLSAGLYVFHLAHSDAHHFSVWLLDTTGEKIELLVNGSEPFDGSKAVRVPRDGEYVFDVSAEGPWQIDIASPELETTQRSFEGPMQAATRAFQLDGGLRIFRMSHSGTGHFSAWLLDHDGNKVELLANGSGAPFSGSKAVQVTPGWYVLDVSADRPWSIRVE